MAGGNLLRRVRGLVGNALIWGIGWAGVAFVVFGAMALVGNGAHGILDALRAAAMFGVMGAISGTVFSTWIAWRYRGRRLSEISWLRFGVGGGILTGLFVPSWIVVMRFLSGDAPLAFQHLFTNGLVGLAFGGASAAVTMKVAQLAEKLGGGGGTEPALLDSGFHPAATGFGPQQHAAVRRTGDGR